MKKVLLIIFIILCSSKLYSAEPLVKFYLDDGSAKQYNLSEIDNMKFTSATEILQFHIFKNNGKSLYYPAQLIDSIKFDVDYANENRLRLWHDGFVWNVAIHEIDSILIYYTEFVAVTIGEQHWMYRNLNVDHYRNGDSIPEVRDDNEWRNISAATWCYYDNNPVLGKTFGKLYNWYTVKDPRGLAPKGWHVPIDAEWKELELCLGMSQADADKTGFRGSDQSGELKSTGTKEFGDGLWYYYSPNTRATNETGFSAFPGGIRYNNGAFRSLGYDGHWWSATEGSTTNAWGRFLGFNYARIYRFNYNKSYGFSVRCIKAE